MLTRRCPWCHDGLDADDDLTVCRDCLAAHHAPCWDDLGCCATCRGGRGLSGPPRPRAAPAWQRALAGLVALYLSTGVAAGLCAWGLDGLGEPSRALWDYFVVALFVFVVSALGLGGLGVILRLGAVALGPGLAADGRRLLRRSVRQLVVARHRLAQPAGKTALAQEHLARRRPHLAGADPRRHAADARAEARAGHRTHDLGHGPPVVEAAARDEQQERPHGQVGVAQKL